MKRLSVFFITIIICYSVSGQKAVKEDFNVLSSPVDNMMKNYLTSLVDDQFAARDSILASLHTKNDWANHAQVIRDSMISWTGSLPEKNPLIVKVTGRLKRKGYTVEKILFESRPDYFVSANLYIPEDLSSTHPALLNVIGHTPLGKADERYQRISISMVKKGFVVLTIDGLGQGERIVNAYSDWSSAPGNAHQILGIKSFLTGQHVFNLMLWDAIRALDVLETREDVDPSKIGITGSSGGGMMSTYLLAFDDRISITVPTCNPNIWKYRVHANLGTDHEQVFFGAFAAGIDPRGDPLFTHVSKPLLLNTTNADPLNPVQGVWELNTWLYKAWSAFGVPEKISTTMVNAGHAYNQEQREITYSWMLKWAGKDATRFQEEEGTLETEEDLYAAQGGSVFNESHSRQPFELVLENYDKNKPDWEVLKTDTDIEKHKDKMIPQIRKVLVLKENSGMPQIDNFDSFQREGLLMQPFCIKPEQGMLLPGILLSSTSSNETKDEIILYLHEAGKAKILDDWDIAKMLLNKGYSICAVDLRGIGETSPNMTGNYLWDFLAGKPIFGQRVGDILTVVEWLKKSDLKPKKIKLWGTGLCALYGSMAGALNKDISSFILEEPLISFESFFMTEVPGYRNEILLPDILKKFDMPQIYQAICPREILILNPLSGDKSRVDQTEFKKLNSKVAQTYKVVKSQKLWNIQIANNDKRFEIFERNY